MKYFAIFILAIFLGSCANQPKDCEKVDNEESKKLIVDYFQAITDKNLDQLKNLATPDLVIFEAGVIWNNDSVMNAIKNLADAQLEYEFEDFSFEVDCNGSFVHYLNHGVLTVNDTSQVDLNWTESAYIKKVDGELKLHFLHSTPIK